MLHHILFPSAKRGAQRASQIGAAVPAWVPANLEQPHDISEKYTLVILSLWNLGAICYCRTTKLVVTITLTQSNKFNSKIPAVKESKGQVTMRGSSFLKKENTQVR